MALMQIKENVVSLNFYQPQRFFCLGTAKNAFGNIVSGLKELFPGDNYRTGEQLTELLLETLNGRRKSKEYLGFEETGSIMFELYEILGDKKSIDLSLHSLEEFRIRKNIQVVAFPIDRFDREKGIEFRDVGGLMDIFYGLLYYYTYQGYKLVCCKHCEKWFATKSLKKEYCDRISPCFGEIISGKEPLKCEQAVRNILQKCGRIKNRIETKTNATITGQQLNNPFSDVFAEQCTPIYLLAKNQPTAKNLREYYNFLVKTEKERGWLG